MTAPRKVIPIVPAEAAVLDGGSVFLYEAHQKIYPKHAEGRFNTLRWAMVWATQLVFYLIPWMQWGERQAVLFDLGARRFYLFGLVLYPQDFIYLTGLLVVSALLLFFVTAVAGRVWCGYACPQTVYSQIFLWIERKVEGDRSARLRLDLGGRSLERLVKKWFKHTLWLMVALWTGFTFVGFFSPIRELGLAFLETRMGGWEVFWVLFYGFATYGNAGFLREQVCKYMCPYARFQSAMFDGDTLIVSYDPARGEPRGPRRKDVDRLTAGLGDCIDCTLCVQVCPTGIDIREGLQYECIGCAACIDACDGVMDKMGYPRGLIRYDTQNRMDAIARPAAETVEPGAAALPLRLRLARPRVLVYGALLMLISAGLVASLALREPFKVDVVRDRGTLARIVEGGRIENVYRLQIMNATERPQRYRLAVHGLPGLALASEAEFTVDPAASRWVAARLQIADGTAAPGSHPIAFEITALDYGQHVTEKSAFVMPR